MQNKLKSKISQSTSELIFFFCFLSSQSDYGKDVECGVVLETFGEKNLIEYMQDKLSNNIVVVERLYGMV